MKAFGGRSARSAQVFLLARTRAPPGLLLILSRGETVSGERQAVQEEGEAKSLQSCPTLCDPIDSSPPGSSIHGIFQARVPEWGAIAFSTVKH